MLAITNAIVRLYKQAFGRGPTNARARYAGPDVVVFLLEDGMTVAERNLVALGEGTRVREHRLLMQDALDHEIRALVETMLDRRVTSLVTGVDPEHDLTAVMFVLGPVPGTRRTGWADAEDGGGAPGRAGSDLRAAPGRCLRTVDGASQLVSVPSL